MSKLSKSPETHAQTKSADKNQDVALICGKTDDGKGLHILRKRGNSLEAGIVQALEEGKPIHGELVTLHPRGQTPLCDVEVHYSSQTSGHARAVSETRGHPAQVATDDYRKNWDTIWRNKTQKTTLLN